MPPTVVTTTSAEPATPAGAVTVSEMVVSAVIGAVTPPIVTELALDKLFPPMITLVPPVTGPSDGATEVIVGTDA